jgi:hypothetical protein
VFPIRKVALVAASFAALACPAARSGVRGARPTAERPADAAVAVVVFDAFVRARPTRGPAFGTLHPDVVVRVGRQVGEWREIEVAGPLPVRGWVQLSRLGCRALREVRLERDREDAGAPVVLRPGAKLAIVEAGARWLEVETRDVVEARGRVPRSACGAGDRFVPLLPRDGALRQLRAPATLLAEGPGGGPIAALPAGSRFVLFRNEGGYAVGRTDGPVVVTGRVRAEAVGEDPRRTPLDRLAEPLGYTHEVIVAEELREAPNGRSLAVLPGGTPVNEEERHGDWTRVRSSGDVEVVGWVRGSAIRRMSLDHHEPDPGTQGRDHRPAERGVVRGATAAE